MFKQYQELRDPDRVFLMELACSQDSLLSAEAERKGLKAIRCSHWNGHDLSSQEGVRRVLEKIRIEKPEHLWIATECTAFSPMQNLNQRSPQQVQALQQKRKEHRKHHTAAVMIAEYAFCLGCTVHWEWPRRCRAWKWPHIERWRQLGKTSTAIISCCQVNVRNKETGRLLGKEWRVESTSSTFAQRIHLPCPGLECSKNHGVCEGREVTKTAFYSPEFARRIIYHMMRDGDFSPGEASRAASQREQLALQDIRISECQCQRFQGDFPGLVCARCWGLCGSSSGMTPNEGLLDSKGVSQMESQEVPSQSSTHVPQASMDTSRHGTPQKPQQYFEDSMRPSSAGTHENSRLPQYYEDSTRPNSAGTPQKIPQHHEDPMRHTNQVENDEAYVGDSNNHKPPFSQSEKDRVLRQIGHLHKATGHGTYDSLIRGLINRSADPRVIELAKEYRCSTCEERKRPHSRRLSNLEVSTEKCKVIQFDAGMWTPDRGDARNKCQFLVFVDEATRFAVAKLYRSDGGGHVKAKDIIATFHESWEACFGTPELVRTDPDGACRSRELDSHLQSLGVEFEPIPADAHWKISIVERTIQWIKQFMSKCAQDHPEWGHTAILAQAVRTWNQREPVKGYSPYQWMLGKAPDQADRLFVPDLQKLPGSLLQHPESDYHRSEQLRVVSEKAFVDWQYQEKLSRARHSSSRNYDMFMPGDLVYFWRLQGQGRQGAASGLKKGAYAGPARILAMETRHHNGHVQAGSVVWLVRGMRLVKACVEQLRMASERETLLHELTTETPDLPWTTTRLAESLGPHDFDDVSGDGPPPAETAQMDTEEEELMPDTEVKPRHRVLGKRAPEEAPRPPSRHGVPPDLRASSSQTRPLPREGSWVDLVPQSFWAETSTPQWEQAYQAVELSCELPTSKNKLEQFMRDPMQFMVSSLKERAVEVSERRMDAAEKKSFEQAKHTEVKKFLAAKAMEALPSHLRPNRAQALRMRWVLTYKLQEDGSRTPKARAVILGFLDPDYANRPTFAPTMTRASRQLLLQHAAWKKLTVWKGDVSGAFLQGREYSRDLQILPLPEICRGLGLPEGSLCRLRRACYGLVEAPIEWYETVNTFLCSLGYVQMKSDPCTWTYTNEQGEVISAISGHVDDFLFSGSETCATWTRLKEAIQAQFKWQAWEKDKFVQCGVSVNRKENGDFELDQKQYMSEVKEINISRERKRQKHEPTTDAEKSQLRGLLGALSWHVGQTGFKYSAHVSLALSEVATSTVTHLEQANKLLYQAKQDSLTPLRIHAFAPQQHLSMVAWCDASSQNRHDGSSTEGIFICLTSSDIQDGAITQLTPVFWKSGKIDRVCRSPGSAEARAAVDAQDNLYLMRFAWAEFCGRRGDAWRPDDLVKSVPGILVTDSRNVFDKVDKPYITPKGASKKIDIELFALKESQRHTNLIVRWVNSDAQLANTLTKRGEEHQINRFIALGQMWRIIHDPEMFSGRRRKEHGLGPLEDRPQSQSEKKEDT